MTFDPLAQPGRIEPWSHEGSGLNAQAGRNATGEMQ